MKWSYVLFLSAVVSLVWAMVIVLAKRRPTRAQVVLSLTLVLIAVAIVALDIFFRGRAGHLFIYDFLFETTAMLCAPLYYVGICSLTEPRGATLRQRQSFLPSLLFVAGLTVGAFWLGPRRYEAMCVAIRDGEVGWMQGDDAWNFLLLWDHYVFPLLLVLQCMILMFVGTHKVRLFERRFNSYYASEIDSPPFRSLPFVIISWLVMPMGLLVVFLIDYRPQYYKYWLIVCSLVFSIVQYLSGYFIYHLDHDARSLADYIRKKQ